MSKKRNKQPAPRNPVAREMITTGHCRPQVRQDKRRVSRSKQKAQDRKNLGLP